MTIAENHTQAMTGMQGKLKSSFDWMKYLEKTFASVPEHVTNHLDAMLPAILTKVVGKAITSSLTMMMEESLPPTMASVLEGSFANFQSRFDSAANAEMMQQVRELLEATTDSRINDHTAIMAAIKDIGMHLSILNDFIASADASPMRPSSADIQPPAVGASVPGSSPVARGPSPCPTSTSPPAAPCSDGPSHMPFPPTWGHGFHPSAPAPSPSASMAHGLRVDTATADIPGGRIKTP